MPPSRQDVHALVDALFAINAGLERAAGHRTEGAGLLRLLEAVAEHRVVRPSALADRLQVDASLVSRQVRQYEDAGFVAVGPDPADRRSLLVTLQPGGSDELRRLAELRVDRFAAIVDQWEPGRVRELTGSLEDLRTSMAAASARPSRRPRRPARDGDLPDWFVDWLGGG